MNTPNHAEEQNTANTPSPAPPITCEYTLLENGVHLFTNTDVTNKTVEEWIAHMNRIYETLTPDSQISLLIDNRQVGSPPFYHTFNKGREWVASLKIHPQVRLAIIYKEDFIMSLFETLIRTLRLGHLEVKSFSGDDSMEKAHTWLTRDWYRK